VTPSLADICRGIPKTHSTVPAAAPVSPVSSSPDVCLTGESTAAPVSDLLDECIEQHDEAAGPSSALDFSAADTRSNAGSLDDFDLLGTLDDGYLLKLFEEDAEEETQQEPDNSSYNALPDLHAVPSTSAIRAYRNTLPVPDLPTRPVSNTLPVPDLPKESTSNTPDLPKEVRRNPGRAAKTNVTYHEDEEEEEDGGYCEFYWSL